MLNLYRISQKVLQICICALTLHMPAAFAYESTFILESAVGAININVGEMEYIDFVVRNNTPYTLIQNGLMFPLPEGVSLARASDTCAESFTLAPEGQDGDRCTLRLLVEGVKETTYRLEPEICHTPVSQLYCDIPAESNRPLVTVGPESPIGEVFDIRTGTEIVQLPLGQTQTVDYVVTNITTQILNGNSLDTASLPAGVTLVGGTCSTPTFDLVIAANCTMIFQISGLDITSYNLAPRICNPTLGCSIPDPLSQPPVNIIADNAAFIATPEVPAVTVTLGQTGTLNYTVANNTTLQLNGNTVSSLLNGVTQNAAPGNCALSFNLNPLNQIDHNCTLLLDINSTTLGLGTHTLTPVICNTPSLCTTAPSVQINVVSPSGPAFNITTTTTNVQLAIGLTETVSYVVTNNRTTTLTGNTLSALPAGVTQAAGTTCVSPFTLVGSASCTLNLQIANGGVPSYNLAPEICNTGEGLGCSTATPPLPVTIVAANAAFVVTTGLTEITVPVGVATLIDYSVSNNTTIPLNTNAVSSLPAGVTQVVDPFSCALSFNLNPLGQAGSNCEMRLQILRNTTGTFPLTPLICNTTSGLCTTGPTIQVTVASTGEFATITAPANVALLPSGTVTFTVTNTDLTRIVQNVQIALPESYAGIVSSTSTGCGSLAQNGGTCTFTLTTAADVSGISPAEATITGTGADATSTELWPAGVIVDIPGGMVQRFQDQDLAITQPAAYYPGTIILSDPVFSANLSGKVALCQGGCTFNSSCLAGQPVGSLPCGYIMQSRQNNGDPFQTIDGTTTVVTVNLAETDVVTSTQINYQYIAPITYQSLIMTGEGDNILIRAGNTWELFATVGIDNFDVPLTFTIWENNLYVGGGFSQVEGVDAFNIAQWDGREWSPLGPGLGEDTTFEHVASARSFGGDLIAAGTFPRTGDGLTTVNNIASWDGVSWSALQTGIDGPVFALEVLSTSLYASGDFIDASGIPANNVAGWNGAVWSALGEGVNGAFFKGYTMAAVGTNLYIGGDFLTAGTTAARHIARWDGTNWSALGSGLGAPGQPASHVASIAGNGSSIYAGGLFTATGDGTLTLNNIGFWNGTAWNQLDSGTNGIVQQIALWGNQLYVQGCFTQAGGITATDVAYWDIALQSWVAFDQGWIPSEDCGHAEFLITSTITLSPAP